MRLLQEQREFVEHVYAVDRQGVRKVRLGVKSEPKGNGKTGLVAGLCLAHLIGPEAEERGEVYSAAIDRGQAAIIFAEMEAIIARVPEFAVRCNVVRFHKQIEVLEGDGAGSTYEALSADARAAHGLAPSLFCYDELAQAKDRELLDNLVNGLGKRRDALGLIISTQAPSDDHPLSQLIDDGLSGVDPSTYVQLTAAPPDADPFTEETWRASNPALGKFLSLKEMREAAERARRIPAFEASFRNLRLNQRVEASAENRLVTAAVWRRNAGDDPIDRAALRGRKCFGGLDLSGKHDLTGLVLAFPDDGPDPRYTILPFAWTPAGQLAERAPTERERFREWIRAGHLIEVPGPTVRYGYVAAAIAELAAEFDIKVIAYDRWHIDDFQQDLADASCTVPLEPFGQGFRDMGPAVERLAELALAERLRHGNAPPLTAAVANAITIADPAGNLKIDKPRSQKRGPVRVDLAVALVMALGVAKRFVPAKKPDLSAFLKKPVMVVR
jgi:phage terminase large subunit-like protein